MYAHRNSAGAFTEKICNPQKSLIISTMSVCLSVETADPPKSNLTLARPPAVNGNITAAVHNGHFAGGPTRAYGVPRRMLRGQPIPHTHLVSRPL